MKLKFNKWLILAALGTVTVLGVAMSNINIVKDTEVGVLTRLGKVQPVPIGTGPVVTIPIVEDLTTMSLTQKTMYFKGISLTTAQDAASPAKGNIVVNYRLKRESAPTVMIKYGSAEAYFNQELEERVHSLANKFAAGVADTRTLMEADTRAALGEFLLEELKIHAKHVDITQVLPQSVFPHETIKGRIDRAAERAEDERIEQHNLEVAQKEALTKEAKSEGEEKQRVALARADQFEREARANARAHEIKVVADAEFHAKKMEADGNKLLDKSLTSNILRKMEIENERVKAGRWDGSVPQYQIGETPSSLWLPNTGK